MKKLGLFTLFLLVSLYSWAQPAIVSGTSAVGSFPIVTGNIVSGILVSEEDFTLVNKAANLFAQDIEAITGKKPMVTQQPPSSKYLIIIGSIQQSPYIKQLINEKKLDISPIKNKWEGFIIKQVKNPFKGVELALVIAGNDRRGTAFGVFELSRQAGVSPWYWWADVPVKKSAALYAHASKAINDAPKVKYRGIFINDEAPALSNWSREKFGGFNHLFYEKVFELMLRLKSNYIWPAMWGNAFYDDDSLNIKTADNYGIVIGTSHHEPLMRAHDEWRRHGSGKWNYDSNEVRLQEFWRKGIQRATNEKIVSVGMRGDGDEPMSRETATALLERIVKDQRRIITEVTGKSAEKTPQLWALYKEVQDYYDKGMRVPDDVTLLLCDDNWGNIRKLPKAKEKPRKGGYGIYYHFDYVGGPRNYKWVNTNPLPRVWEQMHLAWEFNAREIWIVNVGDIKPMELPISFFLDYAWNPEKISADDIQPYTQQWASEQFGASHSEPIAEILASYAKFNGRRKPELLDANTYSLYNYHELERVTNAYNELYKKAQAIYEQLTAEKRDAYFQLVLHPVKAGANLQELYYHVANNHHAFSQQDPDANEYASKAKYNYLQDSLISREYHLLNNGKWNHMMSQTHIGYTYWQQPPAQRMPALKMVESSDPEKAMRISTGPSIEKQSDSKHLVPQNPQVNSYFEKNGYVSIEANNYSSAVNNKEKYWKVLPDHGRTGSAITLFPVTADSVHPGITSPHLTYDIYLSQTGKVELHTYSSPTLNFHNNQGLRFAVSLDDEKPQVIVLNKEDNNVRVWENWVANNIIIKKSSHQVNKTGKHTLRFWIIDPGIVLQKLVIDAGGLKPSYLGPPPTGIIVKQR